MRERALQRQLDSRSNLGAAQLRMASVTGKGADVEMMDYDDAERQDIVIVKETGKFIINDLEMPKMQQKKNLGKRSRVEAAKESDVESSAGDNVSESDTDNEDGGNLKNKLKQATKRQRTGESFKQKQFGQKEAY